MPRQTSFSSGELDRLIQGRTDLGLFGHGARKLLNFVVNKQGAAVTRPGMAKCWQAKEPQVVLVPFLLPGTNSARVLELGNLYCRIYDSGTLALAALELVTPFTTNDLANIRWAQAGNVITITCPTREPQEITIEAASATIFPVRYGPPGDAPGDAPMEAAFPDGLGNKMPVLVSWQPTTLFVIDAAHPPREWKYKVSTLMQHNTTGQVIETLPRDITQYDSGGDVTSGSAGAGPIVDLPADNLLMLFSDAPIYIAPGYGAVVADPANWTTIGYIYYRGRGRLFGLVGDTDSNALFADFGDEPDYLTPPLRGESPFKANEFPVAVAYFQQRRAFGGSSDRGNTWWASAVAEHANFDAPILNWHGQPIEATLIGGDKRETIVSMAQLDHLFVLTDSGVWIVGRANVPLDYDTFPSVCREVDKVGSLPIMPLVVDGKALVYPRSEGRGIRALIPGGEDGTSAADISWHAEHLFRGRNRGIRSWCYARDPLGIAWVALNDGTLVTVTRGGDGQWAWAHHERAYSATVLEEGERAISLCSVPGSHQNGDIRCDDVFVAIFDDDSLITRIERITPNTQDSLPRYSWDPLFDGNMIGSFQTTYPLDSWVRRTVTKATGHHVAVSLIDSLSHLEGKEVWISCPGIEPLGPRTVTGGTVTIPAGWGPALDEKGWEFFTALGTLPVYASFAAWVAAGSPGDPYSTFGVGVGTAFTCDLGLLDAAPGTLNNKNVVWVGFELDNAVGVLVGEDFENLVAWEPRRVSDGYGGVGARSEMAKVNVKGSWNLRGQAVLRQEKPLPVTVLGVTRELAQGGK